MLVNFMWFRMAKRAQTRPSAAVDRASARVSAAFGARSSARGSLRTWAWPGPRPAARHASPPSTSWPTELRTT